MATVTGDVAHPLVVELGLPLRKLLELAGGPLPGRSAQWAAGNALLGHQRGDW